MANRRIEIGAFSPLGRMADVGRALGHPSRLRLLALLESGEMCVCQTVALLDQAASTVSGHLSELRRAGLLQERREGKLVFYRWAEDPATRSFLRDVVTRLGEDPVIAEDRRRGERLREIPIAELCAVDLDLEAVGVSAGAPTKGEGDVC
ncbi:MAG TPA: ArsR family transcriptional regulator [Acidobacteria bacterium]|nr:ArsR family transcriptional regulator [Acidobacteriota bacterium]